MHYFIYRPLGFEMKVPSVSRWTQPVDAFMNDAVKVHAAIRVCCYITVVSVYWVTVMVYKCSIWAQYKYLTKGKWTNHNSVKYSHELIIFPTKRMKSKGLWIIANAPKISFEYLSNHKQEIRKRLRKLDIIFKDKHQALSNPFWIYRWKREWGGRHASR